MQIHDADDGIPLPKPVDSAYPLLDPHRVPRQIVVHKCAAELEIEPLCCGVGAEQHVGLALSESLLDIVPLDDAPGPVWIAYLAATTREPDHAEVTVSRQLCADEIHSIGVLSENHHLRVTVHAQII